MTKDVVSKVVLTAVGFVVTGSMGYLVAKVKEYKKKIANKTKNEEIQNMALLTLLKGNLTNTYFVYNELKTIPDYAYQNFLDTLAVYEKLGGDGFIHNIAKKMESWEIVKTDIM